jgi:hypothetical protein
MTFQLLIVQKPAYLHAIITGRNTRENVAGYMEEIHRECRARGFDRVLIEERLEGPRLGTIDVFQIVSEGTEKAKGFFKAIAFVDVNAESKLMGFAETVAVNRALPITVFPTVADAEKWLLRASAGPPGKSKIDR